MAIRLEVVEDDRKFAFGLGFSASPDRCIWACDGVGTFPIVYTNADASTAAIEEQVNKMIFRTQTPLPAVAALPIGVSIGNPVRVDKAKDHRAESTLRRAIQAPHGRAAQKNAPGQPGRYFKKIMQELAQLVVIGLPQESGRNLAPFDVYEK